MNEQHFSQQTSDGVSREEMMSALFAQLILQQTNMAMMLLGKVAHPESGQTYKDVEAARLFIDQLEMLETKTKGNLTKEESGLLKQSLMNLRLAFVEAVESPEAAHGGTPAKETPAPAAPQATSSSANTPGEIPTAAEDEHRKKFSKKY
jgi:uncharacterized protein DUF1844